MASYAANVVYRALEGADSDFQADLFAFQSSKRVALRRPALRGKHEVDAHGRQDQHDESEYASFWPYASAREPVGAMQSRIQKMSLGKHAAVRHPIKKCLGPVADFCFAGISEVAGFSPVRKVSVTDWGSTFLLRFSAASELWPTGCEARPQPLSGQVYLQRSTYEKNAFY